MKLISTFLIALLSLQVGQAYAQQTVLLTYGCVGEKRGQCDSKFGELDGDIEHYRDCDWHQSTCGAGTGGDCQDAMAREICNISAGGSSAFTVNRLETKSGDRCGYGYNQVICFLSK